MPRKKEFSEDIRSRVVALHLAGIGYRVISKSLDIHQSTVRHIVHKWRRFGTVATLHRSGRPAKIKPEAQRSVLSEDAESHNLLPMEIYKEPPSPPTTSADLLSLTTSLAHFKVILVKTEDEDQECSPEQKPVHSPDQHSAGPSVPQQHSTGLLPSPDSKSHYVTGSPPYTSTAISPGRPETICAPSFSFSPAPPPAAHSSQLSIDSVSFWKSCNEAGCTQAIFADFTNEMNKISSRIQSDQASQEDYDLALKVMLDSGKLAELVVKQQRELQRKQTELKRATAAMKKIISALKVQHLL
ncbi:uncharacterized protein LOC113172908 isoform X1 [Anabas testudineus]|uniref:Sleeping Beauty transposase HTH domain-containing protein n=1 Tax=Anabas testudineus TaxID=64144 RepID=A0AAQ6IDI6_ANATE|nr:uncharacterized protein LOC113172908 isoform X1 [Anabas testudineus]XP_026231765.1 uncharacterized protein LOC113172908 isoform X1 [Anabas testudineus]XP_026231766.1 uncharacterized protein LOC113172908 isoform X1 [Anabas testudineus]